MDSKKLQTTFIGKTLSLSIAESCTGGNISHEITLIPGSSKFFLGGIIAYSNSVKESALGVSQQDLLAHGAVSKLVAIQMAKGVQEALKSDYSISTTGIAGPDGGSDEKPVGTVWIGVSGPRGTKAFKFNFDGNREEIITSTTNMAIDLLLKSVESDS